MNKNLSCNKGTNFSIACLSMHARAKVYFKSLAKRTITQPGSKPVSSGKLGRKHPLFLLQKRIKKYALLLYLNTCLYFDLASVLQPPNALAGRPVPRLLPVHAPSASDPVHGHRTPMLRQLCGITRTQVHPRALAVTETCKKDGRNASGIPMHSGGLPGHRTFCCRWSEPPHQSRCPSHASSLNLWSSRLTDIISVNG